MFGKALCGLLSICIIAGCVNLERNYRPAGFESSNEVKPYLEHRLYFAKQISHDEWDAFYKRFPEYWNDIQYAKTIGSTMEFHPWYVAYAMRWVTLNKKLLQWDKHTIARLNAKEIVKGDDVFKIVYALTPPKRLIWDNDFEILLYESVPNAILMNGGVVAEIKECNGCWKQEEQSDTNTPWIKIGMNENDVLSELKLLRPTY